MVATEWVATTSEEFNNIMDLIAPVTSGQGYGKSEYNTADRHNTIVLAGNTTYTLSAAHLLHCDITIKARETDFYEAPPLIRVSDDCAFVAGEFAVLRCVGTSSTPSIKVELSGIKIETPKTLNFDSELIMLEIMNASSVDIEGVELYNSHPMTTNLDIRNSENITITGSTFYNFNQGAVRESDGKTHGGNIWMRNDISSVKVDGCTFAKQGNDELIAIWAQDDKRSYTMRDISFTNNKITYGNLGPDCDDNDILIAIYSESQFKNPMTLSNITLSNNTFDIYAYVRRLYGFTCNSHDLVEGIECNDNTVTYRDFRITNPAGTYDFNFTTLNLADSQSVHPPFIVSGNTFNYNCRTAANNDHRCVNLEGGTLHFTKNIIRGLTGNRDMAYLISRSWSTLLMEQNIISGIKMLGGTSFAELADISISIAGNIIHGNTVNMIPRAVDNLDFSFVRNHCTDTGWNLLLYGFGSDGSVAEISDNTFTKSASALAGGKLYEPFGDVASSPEAVTIKGNRFTGYTDDLLRCAWRPATAVTTPNTFQP